MQLSAAASATAIATGCSDDQFHIYPDASKPLGPFGAESTAEEVTRGMDLSGQVALVTGCNSGIGYETLRVLALRGAHVIGTGRTMEKAAAACASVEGKTTPVVLELSDFQSVVNCAAGIADMGLPLDMIILNAGVGSFTELQMINGIESIFVINYLGHFLLTERLLPLIWAGQGARIVHVGSQQGYRAAPPEGIDFDNLRGEKAFDGSAAYGRSKLANALFSLQLSKMLPVEVATSNAIHPGFVKTNIARNAPGFIRAAYSALGGLVAKTPEQGAATQVYAATAPVLEGLTGCYFEDCNPVIIEGPNHVFDEEMAAQLFAWSLDACIDYLA